jgi:hypothetical protein
MGPSHERCVRVVKKNCRLQGISTVAGGAFQPPAMVDPPKPLASRAFGDGGQIVNSFCGSGASSDATASQVPAGVCSAATLNSEKRW